MAPRQVVDQDLQALEAALTATPTDTSLRRVYADWLEEHGDPDRASKERVRAKAIMVPYELKLKTNQLTRLRRMAKTSRCPVLIISGDSRPQEKGERGYSEFKNGGRCAFPGSARKAGYKTEYVASTRRVEVGVLWLITHNFI